MLQLMEQFAFDFMSEAEDELDDIPLGLSDHAKARMERLIRNELEYISLKRVSVVYERTFEARSVLNSTPASIEFFRQFWKRLGNSDQEHFVVALLNTRLQLQCVVPITTGTIDASLVHPREVFKPAIVEGSTSIVLSHNHPSGDTTPSRQDIEVTNRLSQAGELLGISVLDHIIRGDASEQIISLRERGDFRT